MTEVDLWFDPSCSFTWVTARWLTEAATARYVEVRWHLMSLAVLHEGREDVSERYQTFLRTTWGPVRVLAAAHAEHGEDVVLPLYVAMATRFYDEAMPRDAATVALALAEVGLPDDLGAAMSSQRYDERLRASHQQAVDLAGPDTGTPTLAIGGAAFFGPVLTKAPRGEQAGRLWDAVEVLSGFDHFHELKRSRDSEPDFT